MLNVTTVKIASLTFKVLLCKDKSNTDFFYEDGTLKMYGEANYINQTITINGYINEDRLLPAIIHELTHAYIDTIYRGVLVSRNDSFNEEEVAHFFGIYGPIIVHESKQIFLEILNGGRYSSDGLQEEG